MQKYRLLILHANGLETPVEVKACDDAQALSRGGISWVNSQSTKNIGHLEKMTDGYWVLMKTFTKN